MSENCVTKPILYTTITTLICHMDLLPKYMWAQPSKGGQLHNPLAKQEGHFN